MRENDKSEGDEKRESESTIFEHAISGKIFFNQKTIKEANQRDPGLWRKGTNYYLSSRSRDLKSSCISEK